MTNQLEKADPNQSVSAVSKIEDAFLDDLDAYIIERISLYHLHHTRLAPEERQAQLDEGEAKLAQARKEMSTSLRSLLVHGSKRGGV